jgi:CheY-like chemotaxis protein
VHWAGRWATRMTSETVVLMDVQMPERDGLAPTKRSGPERRSPEGTVRVMALSAQAT